MSSKEIERSRPDPLHTSGYVLNAARRARELTEAEARRRIRREEAIRRLEVVGRREGASAEVIAEAQRDLRRAFAQTDAVEAVMLVALGRDVS